MSTNNVPGMIYPTQKGMLAGNPRDSAIAQMNNTNTKQAALVNAVGGKKRKCKSIYKRKHSIKRRGGSTIAVPQYTMLYTTQSGPGTDPNSQIKINSQISTQGAANAIYDQQATKMGGGRKYSHKKKHRRHSSKGGNNPNWHWPCSSGGKRKTKKRKY